MDKTKKKIVLFMLLGLIIILSGGFILHNNLKNNDQIICNPEIAELSLLSYVGEVDVNSINGYSIENGEYITIANAISAKKGERILLKFDIDSVLENGQTTGIGLLYDTTAYYIYKRKLNKQVIFDFTIPIDGEFNFFISGLSSDPIKVKEINILH